MYVFEHILVKFAILLQLISRTLLILKFPFEGKAGTAY